MSKKIVHFDKHLYLQAKLGRMLQDIEGAVIRNHVICADSMYSRLEKTCSNGHQMQAVHRPIHSGEVGR